MGLSMFRSCMSGTPTSANAPAPNPNSGRFEILWIEQIECNVVAKIKYLDCLNFEGVKICVYRGMSCSQIRDSKILDPHFSESGLAPFARFKPTSEGEDAARNFARVIGQKRRLND